MRRVRGRLSGARAYVRRARSSVGTLLAGALIGFVVASVAGQILGGAPILGGTGEPQEARRYVIGVLESDAETLLALVPRRDIVSRAQQLQAGREAESAAQQFTVQTLTYLGGSTYGNAGVHIYAVGIRRADGEEGILPMILTLTEGKVVRIE